VNDWTPAQRLGASKSLESNVKAIGPDFVEIEQKGKVLRLPNDAVIINAGGILATQFLKEVGVEVETKYGTR